MIASRLAASGGSRKSEPPGWRVLSAAPGGNLDLDAVLLAVVR